MRIGKQGKFVRAAGFAVLACGSAMLLPPSFNTASAGGKGEGVALPFAVAEEIANAFYACARRKNKPRSIRILDRFGNTVYAGRMDGQITDNVDAALLKARAAVYFRESTVSWRKRAEEDPLQAMWIAQRGQFLAPVGLPIIIDNQFVGAVGIGGASGDCAREALALVGDKQGASADAAAPCEKCWTDEEVLKRNPNPSRAHQLEPWPPHRIIDNVWYVGTRNLASFLITTDEGHVLVNTNDEETLPLIRRSVEELGFAWTDIRFILGSHAHEDHMSGNVLAKQQTGATVVAMSQDVPLLEQMTAAGKPHPIDRVINHGDTVMLGGETLTAHLTPGHTPGTTTWTLSAEDDGRSYDVVILGGATATPRTDTTDKEIQEQFQRAFIVLRSLSCDVPLGPHAPIHHMEEKYERLVADAGANPYIDPAGCREELALSERVFYLLLDLQLKVGAPR